MSTRIQSTRDLQTIRSFVSALRVLWESLQTFVQLRVFPQPPLNKMGIEHQTEQSSYLWTGGHYGDDSPMPRFSPQGIGMRSFPAKGAQLPELKMMDLSQVTLKDTIVSARGARSSQIRGQDGSKISFVLGTKSDPVTTPFGVGLCLRPPPPGTIAGRRRMEKDQRGPQHQ